MLLCIHTHTQTHRHTHRDKVIALSALPYYVIGADNGESFRAEAFYVKIASTSSLAKATPLSLRCHKILLNSTRCLIAFVTAKAQTRRASGCVVGCRTCHREVAGSNLGRGYFAPRSTQPSIPPGPVNEYQLRLGRQRQVWLIPIADERVCAGNTAKSLDNACYT